MGVLGVRWRAFDHASYHVKQIDRLLNNMLQIESLTNIYIYEWRRSLKDNGFKNNATQLGQQRNALPFICGMIVPKAHSASSVSYPGMNGNNSLQYCLL